MVCIEKNLYQNRANSEREKTFRYKLTKEAHEDVNSSRTWITDQEY